MKPIDNDAKRTDANNAINDALQRHQDDQRRAEADHQGSVQPTGSDTPAKEAQTDMQARDSQRTIEQEARKVAQGDGAGAAAFGRSAGAGAATGDERLAEAVDVANQQQDVGENWRRYADHAGDERLLPSVEEQARDEASDEERRAEEMSQQAVQDILRDIAINTRKILG